MSSQVVEQQQCDFAHGDREYQEPTDRAHKEQARSDQEVERQEEDHTSSIPLTATEQAFLGLVVASLARRIAVMAAKQAICLVWQIFDFIASSTDERAIDIVWSEEQATFLEVARLPSFILSYASAFAFVFVQICFVVFQFNILAEWIE